MDGQIKTVLMVTLSGLNEKRIWPCQCQHWGRSLVQNGSSWLWSGCLLHHAWIIKVNASDKLISNDILYCRKGEVPSILEHNQASARWPTVQSGTFALLAGLVLCRGLSHGGEGNNTGDCSSLPLRYIQYTVLYYCTVPKALFHALIMIHPK